MMADRAVTLRIRQAAQRGASSSTEGLDGRPSALRRPPGSSSSSASSTSRRWRSRPRPTTTTASTSSPSRPRSSRRRSSRYFPPMANNWMKLVVDAPVSRLGSRASASTLTRPRPGWDQAADQDAWAIWQANSLDALSLMVHTEAIKCGVCNVLVTPPEDGEEPLVTPEHPAQSYVLCSLRRPAQAPGGDQTLGRRDRRLRLLLPVPARLRATATARLASSTAARSEHVQWAP